MKTRRGSEGDGVHNKKPSILSSRRFSKTTETTSVVLMSVCPVNHVEIWSFSL